MTIIRRIIFIIVLLGLAFVFYRFFNPDGADRLVAKLRGVELVSNISGAQTTISTGEILTGEELTGETSTGIFITGSILTGETFTGKVTTGATTNTGSNKTGFQTSGETLGVIDTMDGFSEIIDTSSSTKAIKGDLNYQNTDYNFSMTFPGSREGYTIENYTGKEIKAQFVFSFDKKDYFILYVVSNNYYSDNKSSQLNYLSYLAQDATNTFAYKILENSDTKSKAIPYILKTFKLKNTTSPSIIAPTPTSNVIKTKNTTIIKKTTTTKSDGNYLRNIFDSFVK